MLREVLAMSPILVIPMASLFLFLTVFLGHTLRTFARRASAYEPIARLPLDEESHHE